MAKSKDDDTIPAADARGLAKEVETRKSCGLVMPISTIDGLSADHWLDVRTIIAEAIEGIADPRFAVKLVSEADDAGFIQKRIVQNVYSSDIVVCDVSGKNPNVMFELGMRLAFDRPVVIVKDDKTDYSFDTSIIEHVPYRRDLRYADVVAFKQRLAAKVVATERLSAEPAASFLQSFGKFHVASLDQAEVPAITLVLERIEELRQEMAVVPRDDAPVGSKAGLKVVQIRFDKRLTPTDFEYVFNQAARLPGIVGVSRTPYENDLVLLSENEPDTENIRAVLLPHSVAKILHTQRMPSSAALKLSREFMHGRKSLISQ